MANLRGRTVPAAEYQLTANVWIRGILAWRRPLRYSHEQGLASRILEPANCSH